MVIVTKDHEREQPPRNIMMDFVEEDEEETRIHNMVIDADELLHVRNRINELYFNQKVIVAPCLSKLYLSRQPKVIDADGKTSPDWFYFGTGMTAIIYDTERNDVKMTLFDKNDIRLLWCLKWTEFVNFQMPTSNFHIINTEADDTHHVGILYENKDVAELIANTVTLIYDSIKMSSLKSKDCVSRSLRSSSLKSFSKTLEHDDLEKRTSLRDSLLARNRHNSDNAPPRNREMRSATVHEFSGMVARRAIEISTDSRRPKSDCPTDQSKLLKLSRADSFRRMKSKSFDTPSEPTVTTKNARKLTTTENSSFRESIVRALFKKRRISRTQSLKVEDCGACVGGDDTTHQHGDSKQYERSVKLVKPRASTDTMLLQGDAMRFVIEVGLSARTARERKHWAKNLSSEDMPSTDLCVTEL